MKDEDKAELGIDDIGKGDYTWEVYLNSGMCEYVEADDCNHDGGVLSFGIRIGQDDGVLVRAYGPGQWYDVRIVRGK